MPKVGCREEGVYTLSVTNTRKKKRGPAASSELPPGVAYGLLKMERIKDYTLLENIYLLIRNASVPKSRMTKSRRPSMICAGSPLLLERWRRLLTMTMQLLSPHLDQSITPPFVDKELLEPGCTILLHHSHRPPSGRLGLYG